MVIKVTSSRFTMEHQTSRRVSTIIVRIQHLTRSLHLRNNNFQRINRNTMIRTARPNRRHILRIRDRRQPHTRRLRAASLQNRHNGQLNRRHLVVITKTSSSLFNTRATDNTIRTTKLSITRRHQRIGLSTRFTIRVISRHQGNFTQVRLLVIRPIRHHTVVTRLTTMRVTWHNATRRFSIMIIFGNTTNTGNFRRVLFDFTTNRRM